MATDITKMIDNLCGFYDFRDKKIVYVGAGGGQFIDFGRAARRIVAVDNNPDALAQLRLAVAAKKMEDLFEYILDDFYNTTVDGDVVLFEYCLHEMTDASKAVARARALAPDVVVFDHAPGSEWAFYVHEEDKVRLSAAAIKQAGIRAQSLFQAEHRFKNHAELLAKVSPQGAAAVERIARFRHATDIVIPMIYSATLL